jgi:hypothetical protein
MLCAHGIGPSPTLTAAPLDRLTHHAHILTPRGESYRASKRKAGADNRSTPSNNKE